MTPREAAVVSAYTGYLLGSMAALHEYVEEILGRPVWSHELGAPGFAERVREASRADFMALEVTDPDTGVTLTGKGF